MKMPILGWRKVGWHMPLALESGRSVSRSTFNELTCIDHDVHDHVIKLALAQRPAAVLPWLPPIKYHSAGDILSLQLIRHFMVATTSRRSILACSLPVHYTGWLGRLGQRPNGAISGEVKP